MTTEDDSEVEGDRSERRDADRASPATKRRPAFIVAALAGVFLIGAGGYWYSQRPAQIGVELHVACGQLSCSREPPHLYSCCYHPDGDPICKKGGEFGCGRRGGTALRCDSASGCVGDTICCRRGPIAVCDASCKLVGDVQLCDPAIEGECRQGTCQPYQGFDLPPGYHVCR